MVYWTYKGKTIKSHEDLHKSCTNFVYLITYTNGQKYIGKKCVRSIRRLKPTKKQLAIRKNYVRKELKNLPFTEYTGSSDLTNDLVVLKKEIIHQCTDKKSATYLETSLLFKYDVLFDPVFVNANISGKMFSNSLDGLIE